MIELLQKIGFSKYEAEAYYTLLTQGPLTGYELGKRSQVPLSRSYEIMERLVQKSLALIQPGDPPRYLAEDPQQLLDQVHATMEATLDALSASIVSLTRPDTADEFWVMRGRSHIITRVQALIMQCEHTLTLTLPSAYHSALADALTAARTRGCYITLTHPTTSEQYPSFSQIILLLVDDQKALIGTLAPVDTCQATFSANPALLTMLRVYFAYQQPTPKPALVPTTITAVTTDHSVDWLAWEERKQRHLWSLKNDNRVA